jgi:CubicO group peptidase (beta-lactamase class C family)
MHRTLIVTVLLLSFHCVGAQTYQYMIPKQMGDWISESIYNTNMKVDPLLTLISRIQDKTYDKIHSILIVKNGKLVFEEYNGGYDWSYVTADLNDDYVDYDINSLHELHSVTKALTSILVGIAIDKKFIKSERELVFSFFPEYKSLRDSIKGKITIEHLLTFTSGLKWNELDVPLVGNPNNDLVKLMGKIVGDSTSMTIKDKVKFVLSKPQIAEPGTKWYYSGGDLIVLSEIIRKATGMRLDFFAEKYLFKPLNIRKYDMCLIDKDLIYPSGGLRLRSRDLAKIGYLFLNKGQWKGVQIVSPDWLKKTSEKYIDIPFNVGEWGKISYGYQWVQRESIINNKKTKYFFRPGMGGNCVAVFPSYNVVFVMTGGFWPSDGPVNEIIDKYVLPSIMD